MTGPLRHGYGGLRDYCIGIASSPAMAAKAKAAAAS